MSAIQSKAVEQGLEGLHRLGEQFSSIALIAAQKSHEDLDRRQGAQDRIEERGTFDIELETGYDLTRKIVTIKDGKVQLIDGSWVPVFTGLNLTLLDLQRRIERETNETIIDMDMLKQLAIATLIESSRAASKRAKKEKIAKIEKVLKLIEEVSEQ